MKKSSVFPVVGLAVLLAGCGGSGGSGGTIAGGRSALNGMAAGKMETNPVNLEKAYREFSGALNADPNSSEAAFGAAVALMGTIGMGIDGYGGGGGFSPLNRSASKKVTRQEKPERPVEMSGAFCMMPPDYNGPVNYSARRGALALVWNIGSGLSNPYSLLNMVAPITDMRWGYLPFMAYGYYSPDEQSRTLNNINKVLELLDKVTADPKFSFLLPVYNPDGELPPMPNPSPDGTTSNRSASFLTVGLPEVYFFKAMVHSMRAELNFAAAYNRNMGNWDPFGLGMNIKPVGGGSAGSLGTAGGVGGVVYFGSNSVKLKGKNNANTPGRSSEPGIDPPFFTLATLDKNKDGKLGPGEYLPPSPFLTKNAGSYLADAKTSILAVAENARKGMEGVRSRPAGDATYLIPNTPDTIASLDELRDKVLPMIDQAAIGPVTFSVPHYEVAPMGAATNSHLVSSSSARSAGLREEKFHIPGYGTVSAGSSESGGDEEFLPIEPIWFAPPVLKMEQITINIAAWFTNGPSDLKVFAPTVPLNADGWPEYSSIVFPDKTFGGLFPSELPNWFMGL